jgi:signal transduction histidine kinase
MFKAARLNLTLLYLGIITVVTLFFSLVTYRLLTAEVDRFARFQRSRIEQRIFLENGFPSPDLDLIKDTKRRIAFGLIFVDGIIIFISGGLGYWLAGKTLRPIQDMLEDQKRFIADSSHELRTPITSLKLATEVALRDKNLSISDTKNVLKDNLFEINKLGSLSEGLLRLAQYDSKKSSSVFSKESIREISDQAVENVILLAKSKKISIENNIKNYFVLGSKTELVDLLVVILDNAIKYSPSDSSIELNSRKTKSSIYLSITDQGQGIPENDKPHVFERFFRSDKSRTGAIGFGLGLSIAKRIVSSHKGTIKVTDNKTGGSVFEVRLPAIKKS